MKLSKDDAILRTIIMENYDSPYNKIDKKITDKSYVHYHNKSSTCIDDIEVFLKIQNNIIVDAKFYGVGCAISTASTNIFCDLILNKTVDEVVILIENYNNMINNLDYDEELLDQLIAFHRINQQSNRIKCALIGSNAISFIIKEL